MHRRIAMLGAAAGALAGLAPVPATAGDGKRLYARRSANVLVLIDGGVPVHSFKAAFGREHGHKQIRDDARTPVGDYMVAPARPSVRWKWFHAIDYPNARDVAAGRARGLSRERLGDEIGIHGHGGWPPTDLIASHGISWNWTAGCISVNDAEIEIVRAFVQRPLPITIDA
jgi:murein L,D-transpeptidase YafK